MSKFIIIFTILAIFINAFHDNLEEYYKKPRNFKKIFLFFNQFYYMLSSFLFYIETLIKVSVVFAVIVYGILLFTDLPSNPLFNKCFYIPFILSATIVFIGSCIKLISQIAINKTTTTNY